MLPADAAVPGDADGHPHAGAHRPVGADAVPAESIVQEAQTALGDIVYPLEVLQQHLLPAGAPVAGQVEGDLLHLVVAGGGQEGAQVVGHDAGLDVVGGAHLLAAFHRLAEGGAAVPGEIDAVGAHRIVLLAREGGRCLGQRLLLGLLGGLLLGAGQAQGLPQVPHLVLLAVVVQRHRLGGCHGHRAEDQRPVGVRPVLGVVVPAQHHRPVGQAVLVTEGHPQRAELYGLAVDLAVIRRRGVPQDLDVPRTGLAAQRHAGVYGVLVLPPGALEQRRHIVVAYSRPPVAVGGQKHMGGAVGGLVGDGTAVPRHPLLFHPAHRRVGEGIAAVQVGDHAGLGVPAEHQQRAGGGDRPRKAQRGGQRQRKHHRRRHGQGDQDGGLPQPGRAGVAVGAGIRHPQPQMVLQGVGGLGAAVVGHRHSQRGKAALPHQHGAAPVAPHQRQVAVGQDGAVLPAQLFRIEGTGGHAAELPAQPGPKPGGQGRKAQQHQPRRQGGQCQRVGGAAAEKVLHAQSYARGKTRHPQQGQAQPPPAHLGQLAAGQHRGVTLGAGGKPMGYPGQRRFLRPGGGGRDRFGRFPGGPGRFPGQQGIHRDPQGGGQVGQQHNVRQALAGLPFAHRAVGDPQLFGQLLLGQVAGPPRRRNESTDLFGIHRPFLLCWFSVYTPPVGFARNAVWKRSTQRGPAGKRAEKRGKEAPARRGGHQSSPNCPKNAGKIEHPAEKTAGTPRVVDFRGTGMVLSTQIKQAAEGPCWIVTGKAG